MSWARIEEAARAMPAERVADTVRSLLEDPRGAALVRLVLEQRELASDAASGMQFADHHGLLAHAAGVRYGMNQVLAQLKTAVEPARRRGPQRPAEGAVQAAD